MNAADKFLSDHPGMSIKEAIQYIDIEIDMLRSKRCKTE